MEVATFGKILGYFSPIVPHSAAGVRSRRFRRGGHLVAGVGTFDVPLATALCKNLPAENRGEFRPRQTRQLPRAVDLKGRLLSCQSY